MEHDDGKISLEVVSFQSVESSVNWNNLMLVAVSPGKQRCSRERRLPLLFLSIKDASLAWHKLYQEVVGLHSLSLFGTSWVMN